VKLQRKIRRKGEQSGIALLLSIFVLLLVCVVGIAMLAASGTETSLSGNYRSSTSVYYAALSGLEEGRSRLLPQNPNSLNPAYIPAYGATLA
jgi:Tfp pilus assembly protein PilX